MQLPVVPKEKAVHVVVDSTGVKVYGEGEWKVRTHGVGKRRTWRKLHLGVDEGTGEIMFSTLIGNLFVGGVFAGNENHLLTAIVKHLYPVAEP